MSSTIADRDRVPAPLQRLPTTVYLAQGLPGYEELRRWELVQRPETAPLVELRSIDRPPLVLLLVDPSQVVDDYRPAIADAVYARLGPSGRDRCLTFIVVAVSGGAAFANLRAPVVVDPQSMRGEQVILEEGDWPVRLPIAELRNEESSTGTGRSPECSSSAAN